MAWWMVAAAAAPYVAAALQKKPKRPNAPAPVPLKNRDGSIDQMMDSAFNPNNKAWMEAQQRTMDETNRALGRRGMLGSSIGMQLQGNAEAQLAEAWLREKAAREANALRVAMDYDKGQAGWQQGQNETQYNYGMDAYKEAMQRNANQVQGMSNMINAGIGYYNQQQMQDRLDQMVAKDPYPQVYYGAPSQSTMAPYPYTDPSAAHYYPGGSNYAVPGGY